MNGWKRAAGFTLIELIVVVVILGILLTVIIPAYMNMQNRSKEASVRSNAHTVQLAAEDFSVRSGGIYATNDATDLGFGTLIDMLPSGQRLLNPFTLVPDSPVNGAPAGAGEVGYLGQDLNGDGVVEGYVITGFGEAAVIITLVNGS